MTQTVMMRWMRFDAGPLSISKINSVQPVREQPNFTADVAAMLNRHP